MATSLAGTTWTFTFTPKGTGGSWPLVFGANVSTSGFPGGYGTLTMLGVVTDIVWNEDGKGNFMFQVKGPTTDELPTYSGQYSDDTGLGWYTNFNAAWTPGTFKMTCP
jgi:hypothetical protein